MQQRWPAGKRRQWHWMAWLGAAAVLACPALRAAEPIGQPAPQIAVYYGGNVPVPELQAFDWVVLDPARVDSFEGLRASPTLLLARVDLSLLQEAMRGADWPGGLFERLFAQLLAQCYKVFL
ncbi:MAG: hypothetical protein JSV72_04875, partial [Ralstonia sp.]